jgi:hypothetical protein
LKRVSRVSASDNKRVITGLVIVGAVVLDAGDILGKEVALLKRLFSCHHRRAASVLHSPRAAALAQFHHLLIGERGIKVPRS